MGIFIALISSFVVIADLEARPISYSGGSTVMALSNEMKNAVYYHYSPSHKYSLGLETPNLIVTSFKKGILDKLGIFLK